MFKAADPGKINPRGLKGAMKEESEELVVVFKNLWRTENFLKHWRKTK